MPFTVLHYPTEFELVWIGVAVLHSNQIKLNPFPPFKLIHKRFECDAVTVVQTQT